MLIFENCVAVNQERLMGEPHVWLSGLLSDKTSFQVVIAGDVGLREIERLISKLTIDRNIIAGTDAPACRDCGLPYDAPAFADFVVSDEIWRGITQDDGATLLCANCMVARAESKSLEAEGRFTSGPFADSDWRKPT